MLNKKIPINVVMGQLGSGKTTVILSLVKQIAGDDYNVIWLKNEYGDVNVDGKLAQAQGIKTEQIMNGCVCCTAIGKLEDAIEQILPMKPDRIILETAGTAHPAPIVLELKQFETLQIDSFVEVIDTLNFKTFDDHSFVRHSYANYIDFIILNKLSLVDEKQLDHVLDEVLEIYPNTPRFQTKDGNVPADLILSLDGNKASKKSLEGIAQDLQTEPGHHDPMLAFSCKFDAIFQEQDVQRICESVSKQDIYRIKGIVKTPDGPKVLNGVFNRFVWTDFSGEQDQTEILFIGPEATEKLKNKICEQLNKVTLR